MPDGRFAAGAGPYPEGSWFYMIFNFIGINMGQGFYIYHDGEEEVQATWKYDGSFEAGSGEVVIGKYDESYSSLMMDELLFFNRRLSLEEIEILSN